MKQIVLFNNKGGVGKTTFIQHLGYALEKQGKRVLFIDADPQCNLTSYICTDEEIEKFWDSKRSIYHVVEPLISGTGDINSQIVPHQVPNRNIWILPGDLWLSDIEQHLSESWVGVLAGRERDFRVTSAIYRYAYGWADANHIDFVLIDIGPNLGALNRAVLLGCDNFIVPIIPDLFSLRGLSNIGKTFLKWMEEWDGAVSRFPIKQFKIQNGKPAFAGYVSSQFNIYRQRETKAWMSWAGQVPKKIKSEIVEKLSAKDKSLVVRLNGDDYHLGDMKNYHSLAPMSQTARKPIFELTSSDGAIGNHLQSVSRCKSEYADIAKKIITKL